MFLKNASAALIGVAVLACGSAAADSYHSGEYFKLDLSAVLSPKPLGPPAQFKPVAVQAKAEPVKVEPARAAEVKRVHTVKVTRESLARRSPARTRLAHRRANPLDAQAFDARIQVWPCKSGGICNWRPVRK